MWRRSRWLGLILALGLLITACDQNTFFPEDEPDPRPLIAWTAPAELAPLAGSTTFSVEQVGDVAFASVKFTIHNSSFTRSTGSLTVDVSKLGIPSGPFQASATATTVTGIEYTAYRTFLIPEVARPMVAWHRPFVLEAIEPNRAFDMIVDVSDVSGTITELVFKVDGNIVDTMRNLTDVVDETRITYRWQRGFDEPLGRVMLSVEAMNAAGGVSVATREVVSIPARPVITDTVKPRVWWDQSTVWQNRAIAGIHTFLARAEDDVQVAYFDFLINDALVDRQLAQSENNTALPRRWAQWSWNTLALQSDKEIDGTPGNIRKYPDGNYTITVVAVDTSGNRSELETLTVRVANDDTMKPVAQWRTVANPSSPADLYDGKVLTGVTDFTVLGWDNNTVSFFEIWVGSTVFGTVSATDAQLVPGYPFSRTFDFDTTEFQSGYHTLGVVAVDQAGNRSDAAFVDVIVVNDPPFTLQSRYENYRLNPVNGGTAYGRRPTNQFTLRQVDTGYNLTVCKVHLLVANSSGSVSGFDPLNRVVEINNFTANNAGLFTVDPESRAYVFTWQPQHAVVKWDVNGVNSTVATWYNYDSVFDAGHLANPRYTYTHRPIDYGSGGQLRFESCWANVRGTLNPREGFHATHSTHGLPSLGARARGAVQRT